MSTANGTPGAPSANGKPAAAKRRILKNPTAGYRPSSSAWLSVSSAQLDGKPFFTWLDVPRMVRDPHVRFLERMWRAPFQQVKWQVKAEDPRVAKFVGTTLRRFWRNSLPRLLARYFRFGYAPGGAEFVARGGTVRLDRVRAVEPLDAQPRMWARGPNAGQPAGFTLRNAASTDAWVGPPHAFWFAGFAELTPWFDMPPLAGMFDPWLEKNTRGGALHLRKLGMRRHSIPKQVLRHPPGMVAMGTEENPQEVDAQDVARQILDYGEAGADITLTNEPNPSDPSKYNWEYDEKTGPSVGNALEQIRNYVKDTDDDMAKAIGFPSEIYEAADVGSGWSGRMIPLIQMLGGVDELAGLAIEAADGGWMRGLVDVNFGSETWYEIEPQSLVEQVQQQAKSGKDGGEGPNPIGSLLGLPPGGGGGGASPPTTKPTGGELPPLQLSDGRGSPIPREVRRRVRKLLNRRVRAWEMSWVPYTGGHGGRGWRNAETGEVRYQDEKPRDGGDGHDGTPEGVTRSADSKARRILRAIGSVPKRAARKARAKVAATYSRLEDRYGKGHARMIVAAGVAGLPVPLPGASVVMAAPFLAVAELHRRLRGSGGSPEVVKPGLLRKAVRWFLGRVFGKVRAALNLSDTRSGPSARELWNRCRGPVLAPVGAVCLSWESYTGERHGRGWRNPTTGEVRYQREKPADAGKAVAPRTNNKRGRAAPAATPKPVAEPDDPESIPAGVAAPKEWAAVRKTAAEKIKAAPVPTTREVRKVRAKLTAWKRACKVARRKGLTPPKLREYYDARGGGAAHKARARRLFEAHGGAEKGYVVCHGTGRKMHWTDDPKLNPNGYPKFEQGKIFVAMQGGDYRDANVLPEHPSYNRLRGNAPLRPENLDGVSRFVSSADVPAPPVVPPPVPAEHLATATRWAAASDIAPEVRERYTRDMAGVLARMPEGFRREAVRAIDRGGATFHPDPAAVEAACRAISGRTEKGVVGFVHQRPGGAVALHVDGGPDPVGTYAHELAHAADADRYYSDKPGWQKAYAAEIKKGRNLLSRYALTSPAEGFAEMHRAIVTHGIDVVRQRWPKCVKFLEAERLL